MNTDTQSHNRSVSLMKSETHDEIPQPKPMNVERIVEEAQNFEFNPLIPLKYWLRTASTLLKEAKIYEHEGNEQQLYLLLFRHATLVLRHLSSHPDALQPMHRLALLRANKDVQSSLAKLEVLKPRLNKRYESYEQNLKESDTRVNTPCKTVDNIHIHEFASDDSPWLQLADSVPITSSESAIPRDNYDIAIALAQDEIRRRTSVTNSLRPVVIKRNKQPNREADGQDNWDDVSRKDEQEIHQTALELQPKTSNLRTRSDGAARPRLENPSPTSENLNSKYRYPEVHQQVASQSGTSGDQFGSPSENWSSKISRVTQPPDPPPKARESIVFDNRTSLNSTQETDSDMEDTVGTVQSPTFSPHKTSAFTFKYSASLENGTFLRTVFLPPSLRISFLSLALPNTRANLETCGILCGTLISNALFISKLVIPDQECTSDTCETINEDKLFDYVDGEDLMVLGWIHTHPTQTCFMSSRDLHTHAGYQAMMPESIAIVCAPSRGEWGIFRLTDPPGLGVILKCTQTGLFHPHAENHIYTDALRPGHVHEAKGLNFDIVDLRMNY